MRAHWQPRIAAPPICPIRTAQFAELLSSGLRVRDAQIAMGMTKGQAASTMRRIRTDLGEQAR